MTHTTSQITQTTQTALLSQHSARLRADVALYPGRDGLMLRVGATHRRVHLTSRDADALLDALVDGGRPAAEAAGAALDVLVDAGLVDPVPAHLSITGDGALAGALRDALARMGVRVGPGGSSVVALDDDRGLPPGDHAGGDVCWVSAELVLLAPPGVSARAVAARRRAATAHRGTDPLTRPLPTGRVVTSTESIPPAGLELAAVTVAAELLRDDRPAHEVLTVDLHGLRVTGRPVLPVPQAPR